MASRPQQRRWSGTAKGESVPSSSSRLQTGQPSVVRDLVAPMDPRVSAATHAAALGAGILRSAPFLQQQDNQASAALLRSGDRSLYSLDAVVPVSALGDMLREVGLPATSISSILLQLEKDSAANGAPVGHVDFKTFEAALGSIVTAPPSVDAAVEEVEDALKEVFRGRYDSARDAWRALDTDNDGAVSAEDLSAAIRAMLPGIGERLADAVAERSASEGWLGWCDYGQFTRKYFPEIPPPAPTQTDAQRWVAARRARLSRLNIGSTQVGARGGNSKNGNSSAAPVIAALRKKFDSAPSAFVYLDDSHSGKIDRHRFCTVMRGLNVTLGDEALETLFKSADVDKDGELTFPEWINTFGWDAESGSMTMNWSEAAEAVELTIRGCYSSLHEFFRRADTNNCGRLGRDGMLSALREVGLNLTHTQADALMSICDPASSGVVDYGRFLHVFGGGLTSEEPPDTVSTKRRGRDVPIVLTESDPDDLVANSNEEEATPTPQAAATEVVEGQDGGWTLMHTHSTTGHLFALRKLITTRPEWVKRRDDGGTGLTPLMCAARGGHEPVAQALLSAGADPAARSENGNVTALHFAARNSNAALIRVLVAKGADANAMCDGNLTPLHVAASCGNADVIGALLGAGKAKAGARTSGGYTALHIAARLGQSAAVSRLVRRGHVGVSLPSSGLTALHLAARHGHASAASVLVREGGGVNNRSLELGFTPLHEAALSGHAAVLRALQTYGGDISARDSFGRSVDELLGGGDSAASLPTDEQDAWSALEAALTSVR